MILQNISHNIKNNAIKICTHRGRFALRFCSLLVIEKKIVSTNKCELFGVCVENYRIFSKTSNKASYHNGTLTTTESQHISAISDFAWRRRYICIYIYVCTDRYIYIYSGLWVVSIRWIRVATVLGEFDSSVFMSCSNPFCEFGQQMCVTRRVDTCCYMYIYRIV